MCARLLLLISICLGAAGCRIAPPSVVDMRPPWLQRRQLERFDPYPDNNIGPEVVGGRPPGFGQQINETARSRWVLPNPAPRALAPGVPLLPSAGPAGVAPTLPPPAPAVAPPVILTPRPNYVPPNIMAPGF